MNYFNRLTFLLIVLLSVSIIAQNKKLTFNQAFKFQGERLTQQLPNIIKWLDDENYLERKVNPDTKKPSLFTVNAKTGTEKIFLDGEKISEQLPEGFNILQNEDMTDDYNSFLFQKEDKIYFLNLNDGFKELSVNTINLKNPKLSPDGKSFAFTRDNNLFVYDIENEQETQITADGSETIYNGYASWVYYEEILGRASNYRAFYWSPNGEYIGFLRFDDSPIPKFPIFKADGQHGELEWERYPKAGDPDPIVKIGIYSVKKNSISWIDLSEFDDFYTAWLFWSKDSKQMIFQIMNREQNEISIYSVNPDNGQKKKILNQKQNSWVEFFEDIYFMNDNSGFILRSDVNGNSHLYYYSYEGKLVQQLTSGDWNVTSINYVDEKNRKVFFSANKENIFETHGYAVDLKGKNLRKITSEKGTHSIMVSSEGSFVIDKFSNIDNPTKMNLIDKNGKLIRAIADSKKDVMNSYTLGKVELFTIPTEDGLQLPAKWILPPNFDKSKKYPIIFSIYGGPFAPTVSNSFPRGLSGFYLAQNDIIYFQVDNRGAGHYGKKIVSQVHRNLGKVEIDDFISAAKWVRKLPFIDTNKVGITGGSYGGYATLMCMTRGADYFNYGIAEYSVTDWMLYDNIYTERYMDRPSENPDGYRYGSVLTHADKYKGYLLITHGTMDDNVHMQNTIQLIDKWLDKDKDFDLMIYPNARHGVGFPKVFHSIRENAQFWFRHLLNKELNTNE